MGIYVTDELSAKPVNPPTNHWSLYPKEDGFYILDDLGNENIVKVGVSEKSNRYKITKVNSSSHTANLLVDEVLLVTYAGPVTITFPSSSGFPQDGFGYEFVVYNASGYPIEINFSNSETLQNGLDTVKLETKGDSVIIVGNYSITNDGWYASNKFHSHTIISLDSFSSSSFASETAIPFDTNVKVENEFICDHSISTNNTRLYFNIAGEHMVAFWFTVDSTGGTSSYDIGFRLLLNGTTEVGGSYGHTGNYRREDNHVSLGPVLIDAQVGDYVELMVVHDSFSGNLLNIVTNCKSMV